MVGDGSYLMMNSEIATSVMLGLKLIVVVLDNRGFGCINRLQRATGGASFNNLLSDTRTRCCPRSTSPPMPHRLGAIAEKVDRHRRSGSGACEARAHERPHDRHRHRHRSAGLDRAGGHWWDVAVPEVSEREEVREARAATRPSRERR